MPNPAFGGGQFGPENKLIEGQPNEYDVICRNASVLAFHLWPTTFAGAPFRLRNICRNGVPPRSRTTTPLEPDLQNILRQSYDYLTILPKLRSTYDGRLFTKHLTMNGKPFTGKIHVQCRNIVGDSVRKLAYDIPDRNFSSF